MKKSKFNKAALIISFLTAIAGVVLKLILKEKISGDIFLVISTALWLYIFYNFIVWFISERKA